MAASGVERADAYGYAGRRTPDAESGAEPRSDEVRPDAVDASRPRAVRGDKCVVHDDHWPPIQRTVEHHVWPLADGGPDNEANVVWICDSGHHSIDLALDDLLCGRVPTGTREELRIARLAYGFILASRFPLPTG